MSAVLRLELRPSYRLAGAIVAAHGAAGLAVVALLGGVSGLALGGALLALGVAAAWSRALLRGRDAVCAIELAADEARVELGSGETVVAAVGARRYVSRLFVTFSLGAPALRWRGPRTVLVAGDMVERGEFRRLRIWALWGKLPDVAAEQLAG
ncbi:MAG TPA: protein YgfX [Burkholderiales bacterium]|nr:protein YgfX [Burkholderiales bacterium]